VDPGLGRRPAINVGSGEKRSSVEGKPPVKRHVSEGKHGQPILPIFCRELVSIFGGRAEI
tara:strand:+ start:53338 stop:53517 length:180 start_codon:yes stop_codon:yes gene_type:complete